MANYGWSSGAELYHYGIPGQKWGQRRYQNPDGSLTAEGRARYGRIAERHYRAGRALNSFASKHKGTALGNAAAKAGKRQVQIGNSYRNSKSQNKRDRNMQTALKVGAATAGAALAAYGTYKLAKAGVGNRLEKSLNSGMTGKQLRQWHRDTAKANRQQRRKEFSAYVEAKYRGDVPYKTQAKLYNAKNAVTKAGKTISGKAKLAKAQAKLAGAKTRQYLTTGGLKRTASNVGGAVKSGAKKFGSSVATGAKNAGYMALGAGVKAGNRIRRRKK